MTAIVYDVVTLPPGATERTDAIAVRLDHRDAYSVVVTIPYKLAAAGDGSIFSRY